MSQKSYGWIPQKLWGPVGCVKRSNWFDFGEDSNPDPDLRIYKSHSSPLRDGAKNDMKHSISKSCGRVMTKLGGAQTYILYPTDRLDLDSDLILNLICCSCHLTYSSTSFCHHSSTTFRNIVRCIVFGPISQWWRITLKIKKFSHLDLHQDRINSFLPHTQIVHQVLLESIHNFLRYRDIHHSSPISQW